MCTVSSQKVVGPFDIFTPLEKAVLDLLLDRPGELFENIRRQLSLATVSERKFTGVGFFTNLVIPSDAPVKRDLPNMEIGDVGAEFPNVKHGAGFLLFIRDGVVSWLEGYTYGENWPVCADRFRVFHHPSRIPNP